MIFTIIKILKTVAQISENLQKIIHTCVVVYAIEALRCLQIKFETRCIVENQQNHFERKLNICLKLSLTVT